MSAETAAQPDFHVVVGSYEHAIHGYDAFDAPPTGDDQQGMMIPRFAYEAHIGTVTAVAAAGKHLATGSVDELIKVYNMRRRVEVGTLGHHSGTVTCLEFYKTVNMLSGSEDGTIAVWDTRTWDCLKVLRGHAGAVREVSIHPTGRIALSVCADRTLHTWNLLTGRVAFVLRLKAPGSHVMWLGDGGSYIVAAGRTLTLYSTDNGKAVREIAVPAAILSIAATADGATVVVGAADETVRCYDAGTGELGFCIHKAHPTRVKHVAVAGQGRLVTASSDGAVRVWQLPADLRSGSLQGPDGCVSSARAGGRLTCLAAVDLAESEGDEAPASEEPEAAPKPKKRRRTRAEGKEAKAKRAEGQEAKGRRTEGQGAKGKRAAKGSAAKADAPPVDPGFEVVPAAASAALPQPCDESDSD